MFLACYGNVQRRQYVQTASIVYKINFGGAAANQHTVREQLQSDSRSRIGQGKLRSYLDPACSVSPAVSAAGADMYPRCSNEPPGAVGGRYGSGCFHFSSSNSVSLISSYAEASVPDLTMVGTRIVGSEGRERTLCCRGSVMFLLASKRLRMYKACPRQRYRWTLQSRASLRERL